jgi:hypothetical protein
VEGLSSKLLLKLKSISEPITLKKKLLISSKGEIFRIEDVRRSGDGIYYLKSADDQLILFRLAVSQEGRQLHSVHQFQFIDSPEWFGVTTDDYFQV